ncbi:DUF1192 domain-containing protein [Magnetovibrio sp.]|uniref:DUF1192 domain-containing protein n=1 Tax=Magnetovibrio sp. TaxID=2024836 RepID=UPI002F9401EB
MDTDDLEPMKPSPGARTIRKDLDEMSIEAVGEYIDELKSEIARAESAIKAKQAARAGADAFFKR